MFKVRTDGIAVRREPVARGRSSDIANEFTWDVQKALEECTLEIPPGWKNHLRLTRNEKEVVSLKNKAKK